MRTTATICLFVLTVWAAHCPASAPAQERIARPDDAPLPLAPEESARRVKMPDGFRLELVASEPLIRSPSAVCWDERGRMFVCEIHGYNLDGYLDAVELNKTGKLDRQVRRVRQATEASQAAAKEQTYGTVKLLSDSDGDGRMDQVQVWADRLPPCYGLIAARGGVIAICAPDIVYLADRDGDGKADVRESLFSGFARTLIERGINNPRWSVDNWIYVSAGGGGGQIAGPYLSKPVQIGNTDFRFKPDGSAIEPVTGTESMFGLTLTDFGDRFHTIITAVSPLPYSYLARNPYVASPSGDIRINSYREIFPISQPDPWRLARGKDPAWVKFYGEAETKPNGNFTSSSGQMIYRADGLPAPYRGNYFICDPANNLVHRSLLKRRGLEYVARRAPGEEQSEFLASTDQWFRPINLSTGPDGAIYIVDMYREIIEDFSAIPRFLQQLYVESLIAGENHGRIWRLVHGPTHDARAGSDSAVASLHRAFTAGLVQRLAHSNPWWRETAQRLLIERGDPTSRGPLARLLRTGPTPPARLHALYTLDGLTMLAAEDVLVALSDSDFGVRMHALQLAERWIDSSAPLLAKVLSLVDDKEPRVRLQAALSLGQSRDSRAIAGLARLATLHGSEMWMSAGIVSSAADTAESLIGELLKHEPPSTEALAVLAPLAETIGAQQVDDAIGRVLARVAGLSNETESTVEAQRIMLDGLARGLERGTPPSLQSTTGIRALERLLASSSPGVSQPALRCAGLLRLTDSSAMRAAWEAAGQAALDDERPLPARLLALSLLAVAPWELQKPILELLDARHPAELQSAAVKVLARSDHADVAGALLSKWLGLAPAVQESIVDALFLRQDRMSRLLDALESGTVPPASLSSLRREQLSEHSNTAIRQRARALLAGRVSDERAAVLKRYQAALALPRDPSSGQAVFQKTCSRCHRLGQEGVEVGPDLSSARTRADETLLGDILDPSSLLAPGYTVYTIATRDGRVHSGVVAGDSATSVTLRNAADPTAPVKTRAAVEQTILRRDIDEMRASTKSLMPDGLEREITPQDLADLLGFLRQSLGPLVSPGIVLFEDDPAFVKALVEGDATASLVNTGQFSGNAALHVTAGQRHSPRIAGWEFAIVENPLADVSLVSAARDPNAAPPAAPRRFRYLRFAWKSADAHGVMLELAAAGAWPPADKPLRRYYSGRNTSGWQATEVSPDVPRDWTVVTVDLWKDFGEFTLTGIAPTALGGAALFDRIELLQTLAPDGSSGRN
jgi:putative membrane-bound dehydrogenase-like protein